MGNPYSGVLFGPKEKGNTDLRYSVGEPHKCSAEGKEPVTKGPSCVQSRGLHRGRKQIGGAVLGLLVGVFLLPLHYSRVDPVTTE